MLGIYSYEDLAGMHRHFVLFGLMDHLERRFVHLDGILQFQNSQNVAHYEHYKVPLVAKVFQVNRVLNC
jgi:hypothetical protein